MIPVKLSCSLCGAFMRYTMITNWKNTKDVIVSCDECSSKVFDIPMKEMKKQVLHRAYVGI